MLPNCLAIGSIHYKNAADVFLECLYFYTSRWVPILVPTLSVVRHNQASFVNAHLISLPCFLLYINSLMNIEWTQKETSLLNRIKKTNF